MDAKELMIGDWVYDTLSQTNIKVNRGCFEINPLNGIGYEENLIPIPLTAEILGKNHFSRFAKVNWLYDTLSTFFLENPSNPNDYKDNYWLRVGNIMTRIEYVHQLQHAMRLCGIYKEIEL